jgi:iron uptake system component EfeO
VTASDAACQIATTQLPAGAHTFSVTNRGSKVTEFYVYAKDGSIEGEQENIGPGTIRDVVVDLAAGEYEGACKPGMKGDGIRVKLTVTGAAKALTADPKLAAAMARYTAYVSGEADDLLAKTTEFAAAVKAGDAALAKELYPVARTHWERIEPVAESSGDLDPAIDARENDVEAGQEWTGFHKLARPAQAVRADPDQAGPARHNEGVPAPRLQRAFRVSARAIAPGKWHRVPVMAGRSDGSGE